MSTSYLLDTSVLVLSFKQDQAVHLMWVAGLDHEQW